MTNLESCKVLLVEDDAADASLARQTLRAYERIRFDITWVQTLHDALEKLKLDPPQVLLLDLSLPDSNGMETVRAIRQATATLPIIVLTGREDSDFALQTIEHGAQDYLIKGRFDTDSLVRAINYAIERSGLSTRLQQSHDLLTKLSSQVPGIIFQFKRTPDGRMCFPYASNALFEMYGVSPEEVREDASKVFSFQHPEDAPHILASIEESARNLTPWHQEYRLILPGKGECWRMGMAKPERLPDGGTLWHGFITDITERKESEAHQRLAARVFETTGEAIMVTDLEANIVAINPAFTRITGYSEAEVLGKNPRILKSGRYDKMFYAAFWEELLRKGEWVGEIWNKRKNGEEFPQWETISAIKDESGKVTRYVAVFSDMTQIHKTQQKLDQLTWRDSLTGLANRALFIMQVGQALVSAKREGRYAVILLIDLDRFKEINEARGLAAGDEILRVVAKRFASAMHADDLLARLDSDEFAVLMPRFFASRESAAHESLSMSEKLHLAMQEAMEVGGEHIHVGASIGISIMPESQNETAVEVLRQADMAMAKAKEEGGGRSVFFETVMGESVKERFQLESELRLAIAHNQLRLYLQPQVDAQGRQVGAEALVRWQHPTRGLVPPGLFVPLAESSDLIVALDRWMLTAVCRLLALLDAEGQSMRISVNISPRHFQKSDFVEEIKAQLVKSGAAPTDLVLEVTEGLMIGDLGDVVGKMTSLSTLGIHFSIDDFGTGYSSLAYIKRLPIHELKIDKSFIQDATTDQNDAALVETILSVAQHLHLQVVAEGVENQEQADFLNARGKVIHQGYLFGRPEPMEQWLKRLLGERGA